MASWDSLIPSPVLLLHMCLPHFPLQQVSFIPHRSFILPPHLRIEIRGRALISQAWEELYAWNSSLQNHTTGEGAGQMSSPTKGYDAFPRRGLSNQNQKVSFPRMQAHGRGSNQSLGHSDELGRR